MYNIVCNTNSTTNANEIKALTRIESDFFNLLPKRMDRAQTILL